MSNTRIAGTVAAIVLALALLSAGLVTAVRPVSAADQDVNIIDFSFSAASVTVNVGDTVTWTNTGAAPHTSSADGGAWDSGNLQPGGTFERTFTGAGTFAYHCNVHPTMTGTVIVQAAAGTATATATGTAAGTATTAPQAPSTGTGGASAAQTDMAAFAAIAAGAAILLTVGASFAVARHRR